MAMEIRVFGRTGMQLSVLGFGCGAVVVGIRVLAGGALSGSAERHPIASRPSRSARL
jgi:hypothetical protein